jgi:hypothetical protein
LFFSALVVNNKDIDKEGKIEVYVPSIQPKQKQMSKDITVLDDEITFEFGNEESECRRFDVSRRNVEFFRL